MLEQDQSQDDTILNGTGLVLETKVQSDPRPSAVVIPRVAVEPRKGSMKTNSSVVSLTSGPSGADFEAQVVVSDKLSELQENECIRKSELERAIKKVLNMSHQTVHVAELLNSQSSSRVLSNKGVVSSGAFSFDRPDLGNSVNQE